MTKLLRIFRTEVAPGICLVTEAVADIEYHDDGEPCVGFNYARHWFEDEDGARIASATWPWMSGYMLDVLYHREDPHKEAASAWCRGLEERAERERDAASATLPTGVEP